MDFGNLTRRGRPPSRRRARRGGGHRWRPQRARLCRVPGSRRGGRARAGTQQPVRRCALQHHDGRVHAGARSGRPLDHHRLHDPRRARPRRATASTTCTARPRRCTCTGTACRSPSPSRRRRRRGRSRRSTAPTPTAWMELVALSSKLLALTGELTRDPPVPMEPAQRLGRVALGRAGRPILELARSSAVEVAEKWFRSPHLRALAVFRSQFSGLPPWYPGTGAVFCLTPAGHGRRFGRPRGGSRAFVDALQSAVRRPRRAGAVRLPGQPREPRRRRWLAHRVRRVERIRRRSFATRAVVSAIPPQDAVLRLIDPDAVPARVRRRFEQVEVVSGNLSQFTLAAALRGPPPVGHLRPGSRAASSGCSPSRRARSTTPRPRSPAPSPPDPACSSPSRRCSIPRRRRTGRPRPGSTGSWPTASTARAAGSREPSVASRRVWATRRVLPAGRAGAGHRLGVHVVRGSDPADRSGERRRARVHHPRASCSPADRPGARPTTGQASTAST